MAKGMVEKCLNHFSVDFDEYVTYSFIGLIQSAAFYDEIKGGRQPRKPKQVSLPVDIISDCDFCELGPLSQAAIAI